MKNKDDNSVIAIDRDFVGTMSPAMKTVESVITEIARTNIPVLLVGESGVGKAVYAQRVHELSQRAGEPLMKVACASMNIAAFSTELGLNSSGGAETTKGAPGTVVFDEIGELDGSCQRTLVYALPDGDAEPRKGLLTARVVSTTTRNLEEEMHAGRFRSELYYRINAICLRLPGLRERKEDIPLLVDFFLTKHAAQLGRSRPSLSPRTMRTLLDHSWPGNVRELENVVKKIVALGDQQFGVAELAIAPAEAHRGESISEGGRSLIAVARAASREAEKELILKALARTHWNRKQAAQQLKISYKSLLYKLKQIGFGESEAN